MSRRSVITLLTDFGTADSYVAEMKGVLLSRAPDAILVDVTHELPPGDVAAAQYVLSRVWPRFPAGSVHLAVVDPGVGTERRALALASGGHGFVGPDNGLFTALLDGAQVVALPVPADASPTFHGRDVFAPAAAALALGAPLETVGTPCGDAVRRDLPVPRRSDEVVFGTVLLADRFGNLVTNIPAGMLPPHGTVWVASHAAGPVRRTFGDVAPGTVVAYVGSGGVLEIAVRDGSAARRLGVGNGAPVQVTAGGREGR